MNKIHSMYKKLVSFSLVFVMVFFAAVPMPVAYAAKKVSENDPQIVEMREEIDDLEQKAEEAKAQREQLEGEIDEVSASAEQIQKQVNALQNEVDAYQNQINAINKQIKLLDSQIASTEKSIKETESKMADQEKQIAETQELLGQRIRAMYISGNVSTIEIILEADSFVNLLTRLELVSQVSKHDNQIVQDLKDQIAGLEAMKKDLEKKKTLLEANKKEIETSKASLVEAQNEVKKARNEVNAKLIILESYLNKLDKQDAQLEAIERQAEAQMADYNDRIYRLINGIASTGDGSAKLIWPVPYSSSYISSSFGTRTINGKTSTHYGLDITMPGADSWDKRIISAGDGVVLTATNACSHNYRKHYNCGCNGGYGRYVIIDHGNGVLAWYAHMASVTVSSGQKVSQGDTIGYMGCTGYSTGPHLHFEIRVGSGSRQNTAVNPLNYVSRP